MPALHPPIIPAIIPYMAKYEDKIVDMKNMFRLEEVGPAHGRIWYSLWADGDVLDWILDYDPKEWVNHLNRNVTISEEMLVLLRLKFKDREIRNPYLGLIPTGNLFYGCSPESEAYRAHTFDIQEAKARIK